MIDLSPPKATVYNVKHEKNYNFGHGMLRFDRNSRFDVRFEQN